MKDVREADTRGCWESSRVRQTDFTPDLIDCLERLAAEIDWAMMILNPLEPWPGELVLGAEQANEVQMITRVVEIWRNVPRPTFFPAKSSEQDHRDRNGWVGARGPRAARADCAPTPSATD